MKKHRRLDFEVDKLTNSIENLLTGEIFETEITRVRKEDAPIMGRLKLAFDWEVPQSYVYKFETSLSISNTILSGF
jgi:hypothetical protein